MNAIRKLNALSDAHPGKTVVACAVLLVAFWSVFVPQDPPNLGVVAGVVR